MDTFFTEFSMAIAVAKEGGLGVIHRNRMHQRTVCGSKESEKEKLLELLLEHLKRTFIEQIN